MSNMFLLTMWRHNIWLDLTYVGISFPVTPQGVVEHGHRVQFQVVTCRRFDAKPLHEAMMTHGKLDVYTFTFFEIQTWLPDIIREMSHCKNLPAWPVWAKVIGILLSFIEENVLLGASGKMASICQASVS